MQNKVLIACPLGGKKQYSLNYWLEWISKQHHKEFEICFCVNGKRKHKLKKLLKQIELKHISDKKPRKISILTLPKDQKLTLIQRLVFARELIRRHAVKNKFDYLLYLDSDTIPLRKDFITEQIQQNKQCITGLYFYKHSGGTPVMINDTTKKNFTLKELEKAYNKKRLIKLKYIGFGCFLIHKDTFTKIKYDYEAFGELRSDDFGYCELLEKANIPVFLNVTQVCKHIEDGRYTAIENVMKSKFIIQEQ